MKYEIDIFKGLERVALYTVTNHFSARYKHLKTKNNFNKLFFLLNDLK